jgi:hypothetical protein
MVNSLRWANAYPSSWCEVLKPNCSKWATAHGTSETTKIGSTPGRPPASRRLNGRCVKAAPNDQPGDGRVRVPHLARAGLVAAPHGRRHFRSGTGGRRPTGRAPGRPPGPPGRTRPGPRSRRAARRRDPHSLSLFPVCLVHLPTSSILTLRSAGRGAAGQGDRLDLGTPVAPCCWPPGLPVPAVLLVAPNESR